MGNDVTKTPKDPVPAAPTQDAASRLKHGLMADALGRMLGKDVNRLTNLTPDWSAPLLVDSFRRRF